MGIPSQFEKEKLVVGILYTQQAYLDDALSKLVRLYGPIDSSSDSYSFSKFSHYYDDEMGEEPIRQFFSFRDCVDPSRLATIKLETNKIELEMSKDAKRRVNLDPGLIGHGKYTMATTKDASFRIPLSDGIYAELSLYYARKTWNDFFWTYCDIKHKNTKEYLERVRAIYLKQRRMI